MSIKKEDKNNKIGTKLDQIILFLKDLLVLELKKGGKTRDEIQEISKMDTNRISLLMKEVKKKNSKKK